MSLHLNIPAVAPPVPLIGTPVPGPPDSLSVRINNATRQIHTELNAMINARLPLALPPHATDTSKYKTGMHVIAQFYFAFEDAWREFITSAIEQHSSGVALDDLTTYLMTLIEPRLWRSGRLEDDLGPQARTNSKTTAALRDHITAKIERHPHVLLSYAWVMYMAIFSGGRHIRAQLCAAGGRFWHGAGEKGKSVFYFESDNDGEDIKQRFKRKFVRADELLDDKQKQQVVDEAGNIFRIFVDMVEKLDKMLGTFGEMPMDELDKAAEDTAALVADLAIKRLRAIEKARADRKAGAARTSGVDRPIASTPTISAAPVTVSPPQETWQSVTPRDPHSLTEGVGVIPGALVILLGMAMWYGLWLLGPKEALLDWLESFF